LTPADYAEAIETLQLAANQDATAPVCCSICTDGNHTAENCHHNPLVLARRWAAATNVWACYHCGFVATNDEEAREHFGCNDQQDPICIKKLREEIAGLKAILDIPALEPFLSAAEAEAKHQVYRWGEEHDATKTAWDWFWTLGYLGSKAAHAALARNWEKALHHTVTAAAMLANWHRHIAAARDRDQAEADGTS
jgi:hypothetical protein